MNIDAFSLLILFILAIVVSLIIGINVIYIVDNKLSDIVINIPQSLCQNVSENYGHNKKVIEKFADVPKNNNVDAIEYLNEIPSNRYNNPERNKKLLKQGYLFNIYRTNTYDIMYPEVDDIFKFDDNGNHQNINTVRRISINNINEPICDPQLKKNIVHFVRDPILMADGSIMDVNAKIFIPKTYMGGYLNIKGYNYGDTTLETNSDIDQIGSIPTNDYYGEPKPIGTVLYG